MSNLLHEEKINYDCPICEEEHEVIVRTTLEEIDYKGEIVQYEDTVYICERTEEEFAPAKVIGKNLLNMKEAYIEKMNGRNMKEEKIVYDCPVCEQEHEVSVITRLRKAKSNGEVLEYEGTYYFCENTGEEFAPSEVMDKNLLNIKQAYRKKKETP